MLASLVAIVVIGALLLWQEYSWQKKATVWQEFYFKNIKDLLDRLMARDYVEYKSSQPQESRLVGGIEEFAERIEGV